MAASDNEQMQLDTAMGADLNTIPAPVPESQQMAVVTAEADEQLRELGATGLRGSEPYNGWMWEEFLPALRGLEGARRYKEMADNDPTCGAVLYALEQLMKNVKWTMQPRDDSPDSIYWAERIQEGLFNDMAHPWSSFVDDATSMLTYGYAPHEIVWKVCRGEKWDDVNTSSQFSDGMIMPGALPVRSQDTIWRWFFDTQGRGVITGLEQFRQGMPNAIIPAGKLLLNRTTTKRNNPEGRSVLRTAYRSYLKKNSIEDAEGRLALRSAGVVTLRIPGKFMERSAGPSELAVFAAYKASAESLAQDRTGSIVLPSDRDAAGNYQYVLEYTIADSRQVKDFTPIVDRYDGRMAMSMMADFLLLGTKNVGSWALADSKTSLFVLSVEGYNQVIADQGAQLLKQIQRLNAIDPRVMPKLTPGSVQAPDLERIGDYMQKCAAAGAPFFPSKNGRLEQWLLQQAKAPTDITEG
jgi:hypothetical protein